MRSASPSTRTSTPPIRSSIAHLAHQKGRDNRRQKADAHLGVAKLRLGHGEGEVAHGGDAGAAGDELDAEREPAPEDDVDVAAVLGLVVAPLPPEVDHVEGLEERVVAEGVLVAQRVDVRKRDVRVLLAR